MAPVVKALKKRKKEFITKIVITSQHREMLGQVLKIFRIKPDYDLGVMVPRQTLFDISIDILNKLGKVFAEEKPDLVLVHGDTPTSFVSSLVSFYMQIPCGHVEAGLRTYNKYDPFPEEINRQLIDILCDYYFAPTLAAKENLLKEGKPKNNIWVTGNTVIDALQEVAKKDYPFKNKHLEKVDFQHKKVILVTCHRRESWGEPMEKIFGGIRRVVEEFNDVEIVFPVHPNPIVRGAAEKILGKISRVHLVRPLDYRDMVMVMKKCYLVATDSGGLQEEAPALGKPVLVLRNTTERPEGIAAGTLKLAGTSSEQVYRAIKLLLGDKELYRKMSQVKNPYGDGKASQKIVQVILKNYKM